jgi:hypothetical protein
MPDRQGWQQPTVQRVFATCVHDDGTEHRTLTAELPCPFTAFTATEENDVAHARDLHPDEARVCEATCASRTGCGREHPWSHGYCLPPCLTPSATPADPQDGSGAQGGAEGWGFDPPLSDDEWQPLHDAAMSCRLDPGGLHGTYTDDDQPYRGDSRG